MLDFFRAMRIVFRRARADFWAELHRQRVRRQRMAEPTPFD